MAKAPKTTTTPAQPWAGNKSPDGAGAQSGASAGTPSTSDADSEQNPAPAAGGNGGGTGDAPAAESAGAGEQPTVITSTDDVPTTDADEIPGMDTDDVDIYDTHGQAEKLAENDVAQTGTSELPSFVRDQISPSGIDIALEADRSEKPPLERSAYPSLGERLYSMLGKADDRLMAEFEERMTELAQDVIDDLRKQDVSAEFNNRVIDGTKHYGPGVRNPAAAASALGNTSNAEQNRRARRAAERVAQASKPR